MTITKHEGQQTFEQWWQSVNKFSTDSDRLDHTVLVLSAPFKARRDAAEAAWNAALAAAPPPVPSAPPAKCVICGGEFAKCEAAGWCVGPAAPVPSAGVREAVEDIAKRLLSLIIEPGYAAKEVRKAGYDLEVLAALPASEGVPVELRELVEALKAAEPILVGALAFVDCNAQLKQLRAALSRAGEEDVT